MHNTECMRFNIKSKLWKEDVHKDIIKAFYYLNNEYKSKLLPGELFLQSDDVFVSVCDVVVNGACINSTIFQFPKIFLFSLPIALHEPEMATVLLGKQGGYVGGELGNEAWRYSSASPFGWRGTKLPFLPWFVM